MNSIDTRFSRNAFEAVQKTCSTCFITSKTTQLHLMVLNNIKHSCSIFLHYIKFQGGGDTTYCSLLIIMALELCSPAYHLYGDDRKL